MFFTLLINVLRGCIGQLYLQVMNKNIQINSTEIDIIKVSEHIVFLNHNCGRIYISS